MKRFLVVIFSVLLLASMFPASLIAKAETVAEKPFYFVNFDRSFDDSAYEYVTWMPYTWINTEKFNSDSTHIDIGVYFNDYSTSNLEDAAAEMYDVFKNRPAGTRHISFNAMKSVFEHCVKDAVDMEDGVRLIKDWLSRFLDAYKALGGELDGISIDLEYNFAYTFYLESQHYNNKENPNRNIYNDIVANKVYKERIRPKLVEFEKQGLFKFYQNPDPAKYPERSEIWTIYRYDNKGGDETCRTTWNSIIQRLLVEYINEATYEPLIARYPNAVLSDYKTGDLGPWEKYLNHMGGMTEYSTVKAGNASNFVSYNYTPDYRFYGYSSKTDRTNRTKYQKPYGYNGAVFGDDAYDRALWGINDHKRMLTSTEGGRMNVWVSFFNYGDETGYGDTPYYTEVYYHLGMTNPEPFYGYILPRDLPLHAGDDTDPNVLDYDYNLRVVEDMMAELTRVAGKADRKAIVTPVTWNEGFFYSGMYAGGRNIWRVTPDTDKVSLQDFKILDDTPTFRVGDVTITFPQGRIIPDGSVRRVGSCGYWVETPASVVPVITSNADRYQNTPSFGDTFDYPTGAFTAASVKPNTYWQVSGNAAIVENGGNKAVALTGNTTLTNTKVPEQITAGDYYAKQQAWEITVTLPEGDYGEVKLLRYCDADGGFKIADGKVYFHNVNGYVEMCTLPAGTYTFRRELSFLDVVGGFTCSYSIVDAEGKVLTGAGNALVSPIRLPVANISLSANGATNAVLIDDYKLYPTGVAANLDLYDAELGRALADPQAPQTTDTAYRLSWMNASAIHQTACIYDVKSGAVLKKIEMAPGMDGIVTGIAAANGKEIQIAVDVQPCLPPATENPDNGAGDTGGNINGEGIVEDVPETIPNANQPADGNTSGESNVGGADAPADVTVEKKGSNMTWLIVAIIIALLVGAAVYIFVIKQKKAAKPTEE